MPHKDKAANQAYKRMYYQKRRDNDPEYAKRAQNVWRQKNPRLYIWHRAKSRAKVVGCPFDITVEDIIIPEFCPIFQELRLEFSTGRTIRPDNIPTIDRIVPALGYVPGNIAIISMRANRIKSDASEEDLGKILAWLKTVKAGVS